VLSRLKRKNLHTWLRGYARHLARRATTRASGPRHLLFALCDHYEPLWGQSPDDLGRARVQAWVDGYPKMAAPWRDADGRPPRHSWFFPGEEYRPEFLDGLATLAKQGFGEVEVHLHHDADTRETLREKLEDTLRLLGGHGHLSRGSDGAYRWAFIHGNWCLANGRPDKRWCGVDDELPLLHELGCYADYTFPAAPDPSQSDMVDLIYWPTGDLDRRRSYDAGEPARVGVAHDDRLLMITGPLALTPKGLGVRIENGAITGDDPATPARVRSWAAQHIHVAGRPEWTFVKVHTHGALEDAAASLLGDGGREMHEALAAGDWKLHYVTAREMYNVARAAMDGKGGDPSAWLDYRIAPPPVVA
jgi:hypothetical protein